MRAEGGIDLFLFDLILVVHLTAVTMKLALLFFIPRLRDTEHVRRFLIKYKTYDRISDYFLWGTGALLIAVTSPRYLLKPWLLISMFLYLVIFWIIKTVLVRGMEKIAASQKPFAREELRTLRIENACVIAAALGLLGMIGYLMTHKPFGA